MRKFLLFGMCMYVVSTAYAQMATTTEAGNDGVSRLISNDQRKIHFGSMAQKIYADLSGKTVEKNTLVGYSDGEFKYHAPTCSYTYHTESGTATFSYRNNRTGYAAVRLFDGLEGTLGDYENFVFRSLDVSSPREGEAVIITTNGEGPEDSIGTVQGSRFSVQFCDKNDNIIREAIIYSNDVKIIPLKQFFTDKQIEEIDAVFISTRGGDGFLDADVEIAESYFISAYNLNDENYFKDMDGKYIGNAYIHPSYFICSNGVTLDQKTGVLRVGEEGAQTYRATNLDSSFYHNWDGVDANSAQTSNSPYFVYNVGESSSNIYGDSNVSRYNYADLTEYDRLSIVVKESGEQPRLLFNRQEDDTYTEVKSGSPYISTNPDNAQMYYVDLKAIKADKGYVHLNAIKAASGSITVTSLIVEMLNDLPRQARLQLSVPFSGFNMKDITVVTFNNEEDGDVIWRNIYGYMDYAKQNKGADKRTSVDETTTDSKDYIIDLAYTNERTFDVRTIYTNRYNADFQVSQKNKEYVDKINNIYWNTNYAGTTDSIGTMTVNDICFTKNHVVVRNGGNHTLLSGALYHQYDNEGNIVNEKTTDGGTFVEIQTTGITGNQQTLFGRGIHVKWYNYADLSNYYKIQIKGTPNAELRFITNRQEGEGDGGSFRETLVRLDSKGLATVDIVPIVKNDGYCHLNAIKTSYNHTGDAQLDYIKLYSEEDGVVELNEDLFHTWNRPVNGSVTRWNAFGGKTQPNGKLVNKIGEEVTGNGTSIFGHDYNFYKEDYVELTGYKKIKVTGTPDFKVRFVYNVSQNKDAENECIYRENYLTLGKDGTAEMDLRDFVYFHLNGIKTYGTGKVDKIELISDERVDYVLEGNGTLSETDDDAKAYDNGGKNGNIGTNAMAALNDVGARVIDARPRVSISRSTLAYPENPNCLIIMRANLSPSQSQRQQFSTPTKNGVSANMITMDGITSNDYKITETKVNNLRLFDGYPFSAPRTFTVNSANLKRKTTANVIGTLILPFDCYVNGEGKVGAYNTTTAEYAEYDTEKQGILEDVDIKKGDHVLLFKKISGNAQAYHPYLYVADKTNDERVFWATVKTITQTPECGSADAPAEYMTNEREAGEEDRHYLRGFMESTHVENVYAYKA
ncbi:MAG: hypothetical protein ACI3YI_13895, partial [Bacteroidaceae bacterium]